MESTSEVVSNTVIGKHESAEDFPANTDAAKQSVEANKTNNKEPVEVPAEKGTDEGKVSVEEKKQVQQPETISETQEEDEEIVEEEDSDEDDAEDDTNQKITETKVVKTADGGQTTITTVTTVQKVSPDSTKTVVTTSSITRENSVAATTPTTTSYTSDEVETQTPETVAKSNEKVVSSDENEDKHEEEKATEEENESEGETEEENAEEEHATQQSNEKVADENKKIDDSLQRPQQPNKDQIQQETETQSEPQPTTTIMKETTEVSETDGQENKIPNRQENFNNAIRDIISGIDSNIHDQENTAALREREMELLKKQQELAEEIERHKFLTQKRSNENQQKQQQPSNNFVNKESVFPTKTYQPITNVSKYSTFEEKQDNNMYSLKSDKFETTESTSVSKKIDLHKIFTPATDVEGILPKNRKLYASSAFYSPALHPTVEDQVELARRISHSLSDISNQQSRGQSMYVNRKKRSVKWVHEGCGQDYHQYQQQPNTSTSPSILPAYTDAAKHRVQLNLHQEQLLEKYAKPGLKVVQTPWEAALNSGSASAAFVEEQKHSPYPTPAFTASPTPQIFDASQGGLPIRSAPTATDSCGKTFRNADYQRYQTYSAPQQQAQHERQLYTGSNSKRELAYKPVIPQGWKAPSMSLPKDLFMPKEIPLQSYAPPPVVNIPRSVSPVPCSVNYEATKFSYNKPQIAPQTESAPTYGGSTTFPVSKPYQQGFLSKYGNSQPPKQQYLPPQSYQKVPQNTNQNVPQVNFNPSPLPYDKLAKFENPPSDEGRYVSSPSACAPYLNIRSSKVYNTSPAPFEAISSRPYTPSSDSHYYGGASSHSPRPFSNMQQYSRPNPTNLSHPTGWGCGSGDATDLKYSQRHISAAKPQIVSAASMPYTDF